MSEFYSILPYQASFWIQEQVRLYTTCSWLVFFYLFSCTSDIECVGLIRGKWVSSKVKPSRIINCWLSSASVCSYGKIKFKRWDVFSLIRYCLTLSKFPESKLLKNLIEENSWILWLGSKPGMQCRGSKLSSAFGLLKSFSLSISVNN